MLRKLADPPALEGTPPLDWLDTETVRDGDDRIIATDQMARRFTGQWSVDRAVTEKRFLVIAPVRILNPIVFSTKTPTIV